MCLKTKCVDLFWLFLFIVAVLWEGRSGGSIPGKGKTFFDSSETSRLAVGPPSGCRGSFSRRKSLGALNWSRSLGISGAAVRLLGTDTDCYTFTFTYTLLRACFRPLSCCVSVSEELK